MAFATGNNDILSKQLIRGRSHKATDLARRRQQINAACDSLDRNWGSATQLPTQLEQAINGSEVGHAIVSQRANCGTDGAETLSAEK